MNFAVIENNMVINTIIADSKKIAEAVSGYDCVEIKPTEIAHIGLGYVDGVFEQPIQPEEPLEDVPTGTE
jgi:hypothetical protein